MSNEVKVYEYNLYSIADVMKDVGGMAHTLMTLGFILVALFQDELFQSALIKEIY